jgi:MSHA biogenesis protein MshL
MTLRPILLTAGMAMLTGCAAYYPATDRSAQEKILQSLETPATTPPPASSASAAPAPSATPPLTDLLLPQRESGTSLRGARAEERFDFVVSAAPIGQVLAGLASGTDYNILLRGIEDPRSTVVRSGGAGGGRGGETAAAADASAKMLEEKKISLNLKNVTIFEVLDALRDLYAYDYTVEGRRIIVQPETLQTRIFKVNYVVGERRGASDLQVISGASASSTEGFASVQASGLSTIVRANVWNETEDALRTLLGCLVPSSGQSGGAGGAGGAGGGAGGRGAGGAGGAGGANTRRADVLPPQGEFPENERLRGIEGCPDGRAISVNSMTGTIVVRAMPSELRDIERLVKITGERISRQVIIEAKIIDVELNAESQQGINWAAFRQGQFRGGVGMSTNVLGVNQGATATGISGATLLGAPNTSLQQLLGNTLIGSGAGSAFTQGVGMAVQASNFTALLNFLETQGKVHVLSNPRISTLNNQKAVIKVGNEEPFVTNITGGSQSVAQGGVVSEIPPTLTYQPFFSGLALDVTPQIDGDGNITLHVHSMVNSVVEKQKIALPNAQTTVPFAVNTINETDSVVGARDGQLVVIAGLITEGTSDNRAGVPVARRIPGAGGLFNRGAQRSTKRELVILLRPTVVRDDETWQRELDGVNERLRALDPDTLR